MQRIRTPLASMWNGIQTGLGLALVCVVWVLLGARLSDGENLRRVGLSLIDIALIYLAGGILGGAIFGLTQSLRFSLAGRLASGVLTGITVGIVLGLTLPIEEPISERVTIALIWGVFVGAGWGLVWMRPPQV